jgi:hypothetical protein
VSVEGSGAERGRKGTYHVTERRPINTTRPVITPKVELIIQTAAKA